MSTRNRSHNCGWVSYHPLVPTVVDRG
jgi:hypothetical protein